MNLFDRFTDCVAHAWSRPSWFVACAAFVLGWTGGLLATQKWNDPAYHLWLNSPTTALTFLGMFVLHNTAHRFERAANQRFEALIDAIEGADDPVEDEGQKEESV